MSDHLAELAKAGVSIWLDDLSRERLQSGSLARMTAEQHVSGVTTNPSIFAKAISSGEAYDAQIEDLAARGAQTGEALRELTVHDVREACDVLRPIYDATDTKDGRVSIEVDARLAHDSAGMIAEARSLWWSVDRPNLFIKIPATVEGLPAITACLAEGISINVTLIFSLARYEEVMDAWLDGLEWAHEADIALHGLDSVASFFVSRVDTETDKRLDAIDSADASALRGQTAIANARLAYARFEDMLDTPRWRALADAGARPQRPLWASTSTKDPAYADTRYVVELVAPQTVNTMPEATLKAVEDHGVVQGNTIAGTRDSAQDVLDRLTSVGIDYDDVVDTLERDGIAAFDKAWRELADKLRAQLTATNKEK